MHEGHRKRMLARAMQANHLQDHEILEVLLYNAIPRKNTNELAHRLLAAFETLNGVFAASVEELKSVEGVGEATALYLLCVAEGYRRVQSAEQKKPPKVYSVYDFSAFLSERFASLTEEVVEIFFLDGKDRVVSSKRFTSHASDRATVPNEEFSRLLVGRKPTGVVVAHNHPEGASRPSEADDDFTVKVEMMCSMHGVRLCDHLIVGKDGTYSYFYTGRLEEIRRRFNIGTLIGGKRLS